jgi:MFS family permease
MARGYPRRQTLPEMLAHSLSPPIYEKNEAATGVLADFHPTMRFWLAFMTLAVLTLMVALDGTNISVTLPIIAKELRVTGIQAFWAATSFLLTATVLQLNFVSFSYIFGRKPLILLVLAFFLSGTLMEGLAKNFALLFTVRFLSSVGGGGIIAVIEIVVTDLVRLRL